MLLAILSARSDVCGARYTRSVRNVLNSNLSYPNEVRVYDEAISFFIGLEL